MGTVSIMMENSGKGADVDLNAIPRPSNIDLKSWLLAFQSFGFILAVTPDSSREVMTIFKERNITANRIGTVVEEPRIILRDGSETETLFDFRREWITGITYKENGA